ncbi:MAG: 16S rRNA (cytosine(1402)-N(4))-methyltransferase RsmH [Synergistaceae bacterium]|nr:16S rRNA (cytosine(1402)-N(4))-methyltransferase RsmH [Synergistaceae bacterium]
MMHHQPVMLAEVLSLIETYSRHARILDGTLGLGGYSEAILSRFPASTVLGLDRDEQALNFSRERLKDYSSRFRALHANFGDIAGLDECRDFDAYVFDLGVSNMQLTLPERGFSFQNDGPLDMRMDSSDGKTTAEEILASSTAEDLAKIFWDYGQERYAKLIASAIKKSPAPITTTGQLVKLIRDTLPQPVQRKMGTHPARRVFQALRICVNDEAGELHRLLAGLSEISHEALIIFVSYHSLEDRMVKYSFHEWQTNGKGKILTRHPLTPSEHETEENYKARSAKLRAFSLNTY